MSSNLPPLYKNGPSSLNLLQIEKKKVFYVDNKKLYDICMFFTQMGKQSFPFFNFLRIKQKHVEKGSKTKIKPTKGMRVPKK